MRRPLGALLAVLVAAIGAACGFDLSGSLEVAADGGADGAPADAHRALLDADDLVDSGIEASPLADIPVNPGSEVPIDDAGVAPIGDCGSPVIADNFNSGIGPTWLTYGPTTAATDGSGNGYVKMIPTDQSGSFAGIFTVLKFAATSFVTTFRYYAQSPPYDLFNSAVGDGLTFVWVTSGTVAPATFAGTVSGAGLGLPPKVAGYAFALDAYRNSSLGDPSTPSFSLLHVDPARGAPGTYDWHVANDGPFNGVYDGWRTVTITFAGGKLSADVSGTTLFQNVAVPASNIYAVGFTAATGGAGALGFNVDTFRIELTDPVCH